VLGKSVEGREIRAVRVGQGDIHLVLIGGLHAGFAPGTARLAAQVAGYYVSDPDTIPPDVTLHVVLNANPDSRYAPGEREGRLNANGVDLNRNWDCDWQRDAVWGGKAVGGGTAAFSEPETQALRDYLLELHPAAVVFWEARALQGQVSPGGCGADSRISEALAALYGKAAGYQVEPFAGYAVTGDGTNWLDSQGIPAVTVLLRDYELVDLEQNLAAVQALLAAYGR
jgi:hypothetical protein